MEEGFPMFKPFEDLVCFQAWKLMWTEGASWRRITCGDFEPAPELAAMRAILRRSSSRQIVVKRRCVAHMVRAAGALMTSAGVGRAISDTADETSIWTSRCAA